MTDDEKVQLAEQIAAQLKDVSRNEWQKWSNYLASKGNLAQALQLAKRQSESVWMRPEPQKAAKTISSVIGGSFWQQLEKLPVSELVEIFGYVGRCLMVREFLSKGKEGRGQRGGGQSPRSGQSRGPTQPRPPGQAGGSGQPPRGRR
jgi:hypothetical protein